MSIISLNGYKNQCTECGYEFSVFLGRECPQCNYEKNKEYNSTHNFLMIDATCGYYDRQLGAYIGSSSDRRKIMRERNMVDAPYEELISHNERIKTGKLESNKEKYRGVLDKSVDFLKKNKETRKKIAAEQRNTGRSATAKKISEVIL